MRRVAREIADWRHSQEIDQLVRRLYGVASDSARLGKKLVAHFGSMLGGIPAGLLDPAIAASAPYLPKAFGHPLNKDTLRVSIKSSRWRIGYQACCRHNHNLWERAPTETRR
jgi:hypothetical protein